MNDIREQIEFARDHLNDYLRNEGDLSGSVVHGAFDTMEKLLNACEAASEYVSKLEDALDPLYQLHDEPEIFPGTREELAKLEPITVEVKQLSDETLSMFHKRQAD